MAAGMAHIVRALCEALSSNPSTAKKERERKKKECR
jgi:hypothetical protein